MSYSIRRFLLTRVSLIVVLLGTLATGQVYLQTTHEVDELFDAQLAQHGRLLARWMERADNDQPLVEMASKAPGHSYERYVAVQRVSAAGELLFSSSIDLDSPLAGQRPGISLQRLNGRSWHVFSQPLSDGSWLMIGEEEHVRDELSEEATLAIVVPFLLAWPLLWLVIVLAVGRGLKPLTGLRDALQQRDERNLSSLALPTPVAELAPLVDQLNHLLEQLRLALERERRFTADAAHEMRTLLAVLDLHADNARHLDASEREHALQQLQAGVARAHRMVAQLLALARLAPASNTPLASAALLPVLRQVMADCALARGDAENRLQLLLSPPSQEDTCVALDEDLLALILRNLIDNALRYSPADMPVRVCVQQHARWVQVDIEDAGAGMTVEQGERAMERFYRGDSDQPGTGLGLAIVDAVLQRCHGSLQFRQRTATESARVRLELPLT